jgi:hypothetical protein
MNLVSFYADRRDDSKRLDIGSQGQTPFDFAQGRVYRKGRDKMGPSLPEYTPNFFGTFVQILSNQQSSCKQNVMSSSRSSTTKYGWTVPESTIEREIGWSRFNGWSSSATLLAATNLLLSSAVVSVAGMLWLTPLSHYGRLCVNSCTASRQSARTVQRRSALVLMSSRPFIVNATPPSGFSADPASLARRNTEVRPALGPSQLLPDDSGQASASSGNFSAMEIVY